MNDKVFFDSNILIYSYSNSEQNKRETAQRLIADCNSFISNQVLQELCNIVTRKFGFSYDQAILAVDECCKNNHLHLNSDTTIKHACNIAGRYKLSFYDSTIIAAAIEAGCTVLYSEDLHNGLVIEEKLSIKNPFV